MNVGKTSLFTTLSAMLAGVSAEDIAQIVAFSVATISGLMAIRYYWTKTKLTHLQIQALKGDSNEY
ncbi:hypothetical protein OTK51_18060 [Vibrio scophthalmi]|uniref:hypothetical protein n=1 Tax=Vibrio scophthalmi TaxID=45658 RepID=UPI0022839EA4|nr:hypothetical protein [Vibrio scophthalmi]MCY9805331.1 hypothetical protein [Vibrio scophthalmi]